MIIFGDKMKQPEINVRLVSSNVLLTITFVVLKALGYIDWSWVWVFCPMWIPLVLLLGFFGVVFGIAAIATFLK